MCDITTHKYVGVTFLLLWLGVLECAICQLYLPLYCQDVFTDTNGNERETKGWNSSEKDTHVEGWQMDVRNDVGVEGEILEGEEEEGTWEFSTCAKKKIRANSERVHVA